MYCNPGTIDNPFPSIMLQLNLTIAGIGIPLTKTSTEQIMLYILYGSTSNTRGVTFLKATDKVGAVCVSVCVCVCGGGGGGELTFHIRYISK